LRRYAESVPESAAIAELFVVAMLYLVLCMDRTVNVFDEALILVGATRVMDGAIPHRDFYALYGPAQFYVLAGLFKMFGVSVLVERAWDTVVRSCIVVLVMIIVGQVAPRPIAFVAAAASLVWLAAVGTYDFPMFPALAAALASLACLTPTFGRARPAPWFAAAGICTGVAFLFRYDVGVATFGSECATVALSAWCLRENRDHRVRGVVLSAIWFGAGFAIAVVPVAAAFAIYGVIPDLVFQVITYPAKFYVKMRSLPFPRPWSPHAHWRDFAVYLPLVLCAAAVPTLVATVRYRQKNASIEENTGFRPVARAALPWTLLTLIVLTLAFYGKGMVRVSVLHLTMSLITALALGGVLTQRIPGRGLIGRSVVVAALIVACILTLYNLRLGLYYAKRNVAWAKDPASWELSATGMPPASGSCRVPAGLERMACFPISAETFETIRYVQQRTAPDDAVFVGASRHDKILLDDVLLYFAMNRRPGTKWYEFDPGLQTTAPIQQEMVGELQRAKPKLVVLDATWADAREPNDSALSSGVTVLDDYLRRAFEPVATFGAITVLRARSPEQS
jgi:hypothetical protein